MKTIILSIALVGLAAYVTTTHAKPGDNPLSMSPARLSEPSMVNLSSATGVVGSIPSVVGKKDEKAASDLIINELAKGHSNPAAVNQIRPVIESAVNQAKDELNLANSATGTLPRSKRDTAPTVNHHGAGRSDEIEYLQRQAAREAARAAEQRIKINEAKAAIQAANKAAPVGIIPSRLRRSTGHATGADLRTDIEERKEKRAGEREKVQRAAKRSRKNSSAPASASSTDKKESNEEEPLKKEQSANSTNAASAAAEKKDRKKRSNGKDKEAELEKMKAEKQKKRADKEKRKAEEAKEKKVANETDVAGAGEKNDRKKRSYGKDKQAEAEKKKAEKQKKRAEKEKRKAEKAKEKKAEKEKKKAAEDQSKKEKVTSEDEKKDEKKEEKSNEDKTELAEKKDEGQQSTKDEKEEKDKTQSTESANE